MRIVADIKDKGVDMIRAEIGLKNRQIINETSCGTVALMVLGQFSDICGP